LLFIQTEYVNGKTKDDKIDALDWATGRFFHSIPSANYRFLLIKKWRPKGKEKFDHEEAPTWNYLFDINFIFSDYMRHIDIERSKNCLKRISCERKTPKRPIESEGFAELINLNSCCSHYHSSFHIR